MQPFRFHRANIRLVDVTRGFRKTAALFGGNLCNVLNYEQGTTKPFASTYHIPATAVTYRIPHGQPRLSTDTTGICQPSPPDQHAFDAH